MNVINIHSASKVFLCDGSVSSLLQLITNLLRIRRQFDVCKKISKTSCDKESSLLQSEYYCEFIKKKIMECTNSNDDCYFYYYSSCTKGDDCPYRHCVAALGTETVCTAWREGRCYRSNCKFRHMESRINRSSIPCYWENQPGGCRKPHCVFLHRKDRVIINNASEEQKLILPVSSQPHSPSGVDISLETSKIDVAEVHTLSPSQHIEPLVVSLDEGEESDSESTASTPMKAPIVEINNSKFSKRLFTVSKTSDFGIKTLEQIRMERIHRESEHFYNTDKMDGSDLDENSELTRLDKLHSEADSFYSSDINVPNILSSEVTPEESKETELYQNASLYPLEMNNILHDSDNGMELPHGPIDSMLTCKLQGNELQQNRKKQFSFKEEKVSISNCISMDDLPDDLRNKLKKRRNAGLQGPSTDVPKKRVISLKKTHNAVGGESPAVTVTFDKDTKEEGPDVSSTNKKESKVKDALNFHIKTLDEIRKEKEKKQDNMEQTCSLEYMAETGEQSNNWEENQCDLVDELKENSLSNGQSSAPKRKLKRMPIEVYKIPQKMVKIESSNDHKIITSLKKPLPEEPIPSIFFKTPASAVIKKCDSVQMEPATQSIFDKEYSKERNAGEEKCTVIKRSTPSSKRLLLRRNKLTVVKQDSSSNEHLEFVSTNMHEICDVGGTEIGSDMECEIPSNENECILKNPSADTNKSPPLMAQNEDIVVDNSDVDLYALPSPVSTAKQEGRSLTLSSVDDIDKLFSGCDTDLSLGEIDCNTDKNSDDIFLELEKMIQS